MQLKRSYPIRFVLLASLCLLPVLAGCGGGNKKKGRSNDGDGKEHGDGPQLQGKLVLQKVDETGLMKIVNEGPGSVDLNKCHLATTTLTVKDYDGKPLDANNYHIAYVKPSGSKICISGKTLVATLMGSGGITIGDTAPKLLEPKQEVSFTVQLDNYENVGNADMEFCLTDEAGTEVGKQKVEWKAKLRITCLDYEGNKYGSGQAEVIANLKIKNISAEEINLEKLKSGIMHEVVGKDFPPTIKYGAFDLDTTAGKSVLSGNEETDAKAKFSGLALNDILGDIGSPKVSIYSITVIDQGQVLGYCSWEAKFEKKP